MSKKSFNTLINYLTVVFASLAGMYNIGLYIKKMPIINNLNISSETLTFIFSIFIIGGIFYIIKKLSNRFYFNGIS